MRVRQLGALAGSVLLLLASAQVGNSADKAPEPTRLWASYELTLAGFNLGDFHLNAKFDGPQYKIKARSRFSILSGLIYEGGGTTKSTGTLTETGPEPSVFEVRYQGGKKKEKRSMRFNNGAVSEFSIVPKKRPSPHRVPLTKEQLVDVLDPLSAAFLTVRSDLPPGDVAVCDKTVHVFDGQQRFDIVLIPKRRDKPLNGAPKNLSRTVAVCKVKFVPIGGYRPDNPGIKFMTETEDVEAWLVAVPHTRMYVPYRIVVPTALGPGTATLTKVQTKSPN